MKRIFMLIAVVGTLTVTFACLGGTPLPPTPAPRTYPGLTVQVTLPSPGTVMGLVPNTIWGQAVSTTCCINRMLLLVNGHTVSSIPDTSNSTNAFQIFSWTPPAPGEYFIQAQAELTTGGGTVSQAVRVCVFSAPPVASGDAGGYMGPCTIPTRLPSAPSIGPFSISAIVSPQPLVILPASCTAGAGTTITFVAHVNDPADQVVWVIAGGSINGTNSYNIYLNWVTTDPNGQKTFHGTYTIPAGIPTITSISWGVGAYNREGHYVTQNGTAPQYITILQGACPHSEAATAAPLEIIPSATPNNVIANTQAYPSPTYYGNTCPTLSNIAFRAALLVPSGTKPDQIQAFAHVSVNGSGGSAPGNLLIPLMSNGTMDAASGGQIFLGTLSLDHSYHDANNQFDLTSLGGNSGTLDWYVTVSGSDSSGQNVELARSSVQTTKLAPCPTYAKPTVKSPLPSSGNSCNLSQPACSLKGLKFDQASCSCVP